ncbi:TetR/AcrR family transcriptional regulator [Pseudomonas brenneri]|uniref:TetR/AcrR family transcriptional regulator n=1 Tax=Pseudomonas brenneri TaxID=129817 RepID=UPI003570FB61
MTLITSPGGLVAQTPAGTASFPQAASGRFGEIREHAVRLFANKGYNGVSMRDLAASLGLTAGSLYNHIESKEALLLEFIEELYETLSAGGRRSIKALPASGYSRALIEQHLALHASMPAHFVLAENDARYLSDELRRKAEDARHRYACLLAQHCAVDKLTALSIVTLLNSAPGWLFDLSEDARQRAHLACHIVHELQCSQAMARSTVSSIAGY